MNTKRYSIYGIFTAILITLVSSCSIARNNIDAKRTYLDGSVLQTLSPSEALVRINLDDNRLFSVVKVVNNKKVFYDDKRIRGIYVRVGTYSYETKDHFIKTVPVYVPK